MESIDFKRGEYNIFGNKIATWINRNISPEKAEELIQANKGEIFYKYSNGCMAEIEVYKIDNGHILKRTDHFSKCVLFKSERDFYISILGSGIKEKYISTTFPLHRIYYGKSCKKIRFLVIDEEHAKMLTITGDEVSPDGLFHAEHPIIRTVYGDYLYAGNRLFYTIEDLNDYLEIFQIQWTHFRKPTQSDRCVAGRNW